MRIGLVFQILPKPSLKACLFALASALLLQSNGAIAEDPDPNPNMAPSFLDFTALDKGTYVLLSGYIEDESPSGCTVTMSGPLEVTVNVDSTGFFTYTFYEPESGLVEAVAEDAEGEASEVAYEFIDLT